MSPNEVLAYRAGSDGRRPALQVTIAMIWVSTQTTPRRFRLPSINLCVRNVPGPARAL